MEPMKYVTESCRVAIVTRYLSPTNCRGARVIAICNGFRAVADYDHECSGPAAHLPAVIRMVEKLGWDKYQGEDAALHASSIDDGARYVWSFK